MIDALKQTLIHFILDQIKKFRKTSTLDPVEATRLTFDAFVDMTKPDKFQILIKALEEAGSYTRLLYFFRLLTLPLSLGSMTERTTITLP